MVPASVTSGVQWAEPALPDAPDSTQVPVGMTEDTIARDVEVARTEETTEVVQQETSAAPVASSGGGNTTTPEVGPDQRPTVTDPASEPRQEPLAVRDEESMPEMTGPVREEAPVMLLQTTTGLDCYGEQREETDLTQEARDVPSTPGVHGPEQEESAGNEELPSVDSLEGQGS